jgi:hypothetical protein
LTKEEKEVAGIVRRLIDAIAEQSKADSKFILSKNKLGRKYGRVLDKAIKGQVGPVMAKHARFTDVDPEKVRDSMVSEIAANALDDVIAAAK